MKPNQTQTKQRGKLRFKHSSLGNLVVPIPLSSSPILDESNVTVAVGVDIYVIGGTSMKPSSSVRILDCRSYTWRDAPNMTVALQKGTAVFFDEKIYVMGDCDHSSNCFEVFDIKTQCWTALSVPIPSADDDEYLIKNVFEGKLYVATDKKDYTYEPKDGTWTVVREPSSLEDIDVCRVIENVIYCWTFSRKLMWSDSEGIELREIKGLEKLHEHRTRGLRIGIVLQIEDYGGKLFVLWDPYFFSAGMKGKYKIWYASISLESRCNGSEVWGNVECVDVLTFPANHMNSCIVQLLRFDDF